MTIKGKVVKVIASRFFVTADNGKMYVCFARKKLKNFGIILTGDYVEIVKEAGEFVIEKVLPRRNSLIRPYVANVDAALIVIASVPEPDFLLVDKVIVNCIKEDIEPVLVINKEDLSDVDVSAYEKFLTVFKVSALTGVGIDGIKEYVKGKTVCLAGQSAVGKSSIINALLGVSLLKTDNISEKSGRGKHTTRVTELIDAGDYYIMDTCGFSLLDPIDIHPHELRLYYEDFLPYAVNCRYNSCTHTVEPECAVRNEVRKNIDEGRYIRYKALFDELDEIRRKKYE